MRLSDGPLIGILCRTFGRVDLDHTLALAAPSIGGSASISQTVFDFWRYHVELLAMNQPALLQLLKFATEYAWRHGFCPAWRRRRSNQLEDKRSLQTQATEDYCK